ncbi:hypothetical protein SAY87_021201 [Trapa incisa]|uniref:Reticulon-like protein n=1 Tax=Trapa incisa TaxID=236973 RepID=A0AAN7PRA5_9MYRT|nr:hypothetical protein SAY87_021201 [Trapa incisa]
MSTERWCVVTGGRGFTARHLVEMLIKYGMFSVRVVDLASKVELEPHEEEGILGQALRSGRAQYVSTNLCDKAQVIKALEGVEAVFHMAAPNSSINNYKLHYSVNVEGTKNVIDACIELKVKSLIYTSSPSVVSDGIHPIFNGDESLPYAAKHNDSYSATKAEGEALVIKSNKVNGLLTCCIRPSSIFGPGDRLLVPSLVAAARAGKSKFIIGDGNNIYDFTFVENVAHAHICAERALASGGEVSERASGQAYFITNMEPIKFWEFISQILEGLGYERPRIKIPAFVMMPIAHLVELIYRLLGPYGMKVPQLTPSRVRLLSCNRSFSCSKANEQLGYTPLVSLQEGIRRTIASYSHLSADRLPRRKGPSKASQYLGNGRVANTLLWKDTKQTISVLLVLGAIYYIFIASSSSIVSALAKLLLVSSVFLFVHGCLPKKIMGYDVEKISASSFYMSDETSQRVAMAIASSWHDALNILIILCHGKDWILFSKVIGVLLIVSILGSISLQTLFKAGIPLAFIVFYVYDKKEEEIDSVVSNALSFMGKCKSDVTRKILSPWKKD